MKITYSIWRNSQLLGVTNTANNSAEILAVMADLKKLGEGFEYTVRKVEAN